MKGAMTMTKLAATSKHGEGTGGASQVTADPNDPSFDPATHETPTDQKIRALLGREYEQKLQPWERNYLVRSYGQVPLPRRVHVTVAQIHKRVTA
jgi:hypothetical protein